MSALPETTGFKPKKSVALSGTAAGNTALCTVGLSGNDLHYRGYDILDVATSCEFEEIAHLLVHGHLPNVAELAAYKAKLKALRGLPTGVRTALEQLPPSAHPMDVLRTGCLHARRSWSRNESIAAHFLTPAPWQARPPRSADPRHAHLAEPLCRA
jgi:citrate synthase